MVPDQRTAWSNPEVAGSTAVGAAAVPMSITSPELLFTSTPPDPVYEREKPS